MFWNIALFIVFPWVILFIGTRFFDHPNRKISDFSLFVSFIAFVLGSAFIFMAAICTFALKSDYRDYICFVETLESSRARSENSIENAALTIEIVKWNQNIARMKYRSQLTPLFYPPEIVDKFQTIK